MQGLIDGENLEVMTFERRQIPNSGFANFSFMVLVSKIEFTERQAVKGCNSLIT
jgi:hypothetical protein